VIFVKTQATEIRDNAWRETFKLAEKAINVIPELVVEPSQGFYDKRQAEFAAGSANADVTINALNQFLPMGLRNMLIDHLPLFKRDKVDTNQYYKSDFESWMWKGKLYAVTFQAGGEAVLYNKAVFQAKGAKLPTKDWTYDDFLQACQKLNDPANKFHAVHVQQNTVQYMMGTFMRNFGGKVLNDARDKALYADDVNAIRGAEFNVDLHQKHKVAWTADLIRESLPPNTTPMRSKQAAMEINGITAAIDIRAAIGVADLDFAPPPKGSGGVQQARVAGNAWSIQTLSKNIDPSWAVLKWLHTKEGLLGPQLAALAWPPLIWAADSPQWMADYKGTRIADVTDVWRRAGHNQVVVPEGDQALQLMNQPLNRAYAGQVSTREALREGQDKVNALFAQRPSEWRM
jgi:ABC-type glycerol-3-phosphate transport system substrate-binding protein